PGSIFAGEKGCIIAREIMDFYQNYDFIKKDGSFDLTPSPVILSNILLKYGLKQNNTFQQLDDITVYPTEYFTPKSYSTGQLHITKNTYSIHHFAASWVLKDYKKKTKEQWDFYNKYGKDEYVCALYKKLKDYEERYDNFDVDKIVMKKLYKKVIKRTFFKILFLCEKLFGIPFYIFQKLEMINRNKNGKIKAALLIDEFFGGADTAYGGYGFLARKFIARYIPDKTIHLDVLLGKGNGNFFAEKTRVDNVDLYRLPKRGMTSRWWLIKQNYDIYISIELTDDWVLQQETNPETKLILWIQDPRPESVWKNIIETMDSIKDPCFYQQHIYDTVNKWANDNRIKFISQGYSLNPLAIELYNLPKDTPIQYLPNPVDIDFDFQFDLSKKKKQIIFLGRLEAQKRAWLFCEIAKRMPEYEFYVLGQFFRYQDDNKRMLATYMNGDIKNLHFVGHVDGEAKKKIIRESRILLSTAIWEGIPISWLEALSYGTLIVSDLKRENLIEIFGTFVGEIPGDGFDGVDKFIPAIHEMMENDTIYAKKAQSAIEYIRELHDIPRFVKDLRDVIIKQTIKNEPFSAPEQCIKYGNENTDKIFYVIGIHCGPEVGLFWIILWCLTHIKYAVDHGYIPVVDLENFKTQYLSEDKLGKENAWEYYFEQPCGYTLMDIQKSANIILSDGFSFPNKEETISTTTFWDEDMDKKKQFSQLYKKYIRPNNETQAYLTKELDTILQAKGKVLGVLCRGTDYLYIKPSNHPVQPDPMDVINRTKQVMTEMNCPYIYLTTEDDAIYELFRKHFPGDQFLSDKHHRDRFKINRETGAKWISEILETKKADNRLLGLQYLSSLNILAHCNCFIGGCTGGTLGVSLMTSGFEYMYVWQLGIYK
ncbi:MAG: glycosyltransferase family 4 protein, partial [Prevotella sp.]|nr:glycosyltransferase family 4 protein [Prevotella sp.]